MKRLLKWIGLLLLVAAAAGASFVGWNVHAFDEGLAKVWDVPLPSIERSTEPAVIARGKHLAESLGGCAVSDCHGTDLGGGRRIELGPLGVMQGPNITAGGRAADYSDAELARLILHGIKRDGRGVRFMEVAAMAWWPDDDVRAVISYVRSVPSVARPSGETRFGVLAKVLDRLDQLPVDVARRIDHAHRAAAPRPEPTALYGQYVARLCLGCHGEHLSGGKIPGTPPSIPIPKNITAHETGIKDYTYDDFAHLLDTGIKRNGQKLDPFMPVEAIAKLNDVERHALWAYLRSVPPRPFGGR